MDSTICRAHQHAAGAARHGHLQAEPPGGAQSEPADHALGRSRGGLSTKLHLACEQGQRLPAVVLTAGQRGDAPQSPAVMNAIRIPRLGPGRPCTRPESVRADKAPTPHARSGSTCAPARSAAPSPSLPGIGLTCGEHTACDGGFMFMGSVRRARGALPRGRAGHQGWGISPGARVRDLLRYQKGERFPEIIPERAGSFPDMSTPDERS